MMEFYDEIELPPYNKKTLRPIKESECLFLFVLCSWNVFAFFCVDDQFISNVYEEWNLDD